jgi:tetratricopeptide (TPR) repeat protein
MRQVVRAVAAAGLVCLAWPASPAAAQTVQQQWASCQNQGGALTFEASIAACTAVIQSGKLQGRNLSIAYQARGNKYDDRADFDRAMADYEQALRADPQSAMAYYNRGLSFRHQGKYALALADYDRSIQLNPNFAPAYNNRGNVHGLQGRYALAIADSREALRLQPRNANAQSNLCLFMTVSGADLAATRTECDTALEISPNDAMTLGAHAALGLKQGRSQQAWDEFDKALRITPSGSGRAGLLYGRGIAASRLGRAEDGKADIAGALAIDAGITRTYAAMGLTPPQ